MRAEILLGLDHGQPGLGLPIERQIEITRKHLPARAVQFDDVALGNRRLSVESLGFFCLLASWCPTAHSGLRGGESGNHSS
jgi:hypothetical protein